MGFLKINFEDISFSPQTQEMCVSSSFKCPFYEHSWSCPPAAPYLEKQVSTYKDYFLVYSQFDLEEYIKKEREKNPKRSEFYIKNTYFLKSVMTNLLDKEFNELLSHFNKVFRKKLLLYYGTCNFCHIQSAGKCTYDDGVPCRFPKDRRYSMEAVGIEVIKTVLELKKKGIELGFEYPSSKYDYKFGLACFK